MVVLYLGHLKKQMKLCHCFIVRYIHCTTRHKMKAYNSVASRLKNAKHAINMTSFKNIFIDLILDVLMFRVTVRG